MDTLEIRRRYIDDAEWEQTSISWKALIPFRSFNCFCDDDESPTRYRARLLPRFDIPIEVIDQWLFCHYYDPNTVNNYGWLNYDRAKFEEAVMPVSKLASLHVVKDFRPYVNDRQSNKPFDGFACVQEDIEHWKEKCTWRVPPIIIDVTTLHDIPSHAELIGPLQLVEGHSRLGYLLAMQRAGLLADDSLHRVYRMYIHEGDG